MKTDNVYKRAFNHMLDMVSAAEKGAVLPSENDLSAKLGVSRTTVRKVLTQLADRRIIAAEGGTRLVVSPGVADAYFPDTETEPTSAQVEKRFMEWMLRGDTKPGTLINELDLARQFGVGTTGIREFLNGFSRFGLIEKRPNAGWLFKGFTEDFAFELFEIREMFELRSAIAFSQLPPNAPIWSRLRLIERQHHELLDAIDTRYHDFSDLDNRFHRLVNEAVPNRFIDDFYDIITFIFHYHYQWNKRDEQKRNRVAIIEHLDYIAALFARDRGQVEAALRTHLTSARDTLTSAFAAA